MSKILRVVKYKQLCAYCPSLWEGALEDGQVFYVRYRYGTFRLHIYPPRLEGLRDPAICESVGDALGGIMPEEEMKYRVREYLDFSYAEYDYE